MNKARVQERYAKVQALVREGSPGEREAAADRAKAMEARYPWLLEEPPRVKYRRWTGFYDRKPVDPVEYWTYPEDQAYQEHGPYPHWTKQTPYTVVGVPLDELLGMLRELHQQIQAAQQSPVGFPNFGFPNNIPRRYPGPGQYRGSTVRNDSTDPFQRTPVTPFDFMYQTDPFDPFPRKK